MTVGAETLAAARTVRTSDVCDALDSMGLQQRYEMDPGCARCFPGIRFAGLAHTAAYDLRTCRSLDDLRRVRASVSTRRAPRVCGARPGPWGAPDEVLVIDAKGTAAGILGSSNTLQGRARGTVGFVIDGVVRDSYEATIQRTPAFCTVRSPAHPMGRIRPVSDGEPIVCAGVAVRPGDLVVADDDGVIVVPVEIAARGDRPGGEDPGGRPAQPA